MMPIANREYQLNASPNVSVILPTRNRPGFVKDCLPHIFTNNYPSYEVIVVDQSVDDRTENVVKSFQQNYFQLRYVKTDTVGLSHGRNIGINKARGEIITFTDDDCFVSENWIESLAAEMAKHDDVAAIAGRILPGEREGNSVTARSITLPMANSRILAEYRLYKNRLFPPLAIIGGNNGAFRRDLFDKIGSYDENLGVGSSIPGGEDVDMSYRISKAGYKILYAPSVIVYHRSWRSAEQDQAVYYNYAIAQGGFRGKYIWKGDLYLLLRFSTSFIHHLLDLVKGRWRGDSREVRYEYLYLKGMLIGLFRIRRFLQKV